MRYDLIEARASIEWPVSQLAGLQGRFDAWLTRSVKIEIRETPGPENFNPIVADEKELLPIVFSVEAGAYINSIRSSLDILAMALVRRNGLLRRPGREAATLAIYGRGDFRLRYSSATRGERTSLFLRDSKQSDVGWHYSYGRRTSKT